MSIPRDEIDYTHPLEEYHPLADFVGAFVPLLIAEWRRSEAGQPTDTEIADIRQRYAAMIARGDGAELLYREPGKTGQSAGLLLEALAMLSFVPGGVRFCGHHFEAKISA